jgi:predicted ATPase/Tfp pilus assembly protein PilF
MIQILAAFAATCTILTGLCKLIGVLQKWHRENKARREAMLAASAEPMDTISFAVSGPETAAVAQPVNNLPIPLTSIVGREEELAELRELLVSKGARLVTLTGPGGVGKTRLALEVAHEVAPSFPDGVVFVPLATVTECEDVLPALAGALDLQETGGSLIDALRDYMANKRMLMVFDNFENVMGCAPKLSALLSGAPNITALVTSRALLRLQGERQVIIAPLDAPATDVTSAADATANEAVRLFAERARDVQPNFEVTDANAAAVAEICRRLEGLPLALELAAARIKLLSPQDVLARLDSSLKLLTGGSRENTRQQTMRDAVAWSYDLLDDGERALFRRLAVFADSFTLAAAEGSFGDDEETGSVLDVVESLVNESLLQQTANGRLSMMGMVREFAQERLAASGEEPAARAHHASYFLRIATEGGPAMRSPLRELWTARLNDELPNLRLAFEWFLGNGEGEAAMRLAGSLRWFWMQRGWGGEGRRWAQRALNASSLEPTAGRAEALLGAGQLAIMQGDPRAARRALEQSVRIWRTVPGHAGLAEALCFLGNALENAEDPDAAQPCYEESLALHEKAGNRWGILHVLISLGLRMSQRRDYIGARARMEEALRIATECKDAWSYTHCLNHLGDLARCMGDYARAGDFYNQALVAFEAQGQRRVLPSMWHNIGYVELHKGDYAAALGRFRDAMSAFHEQADRRGVAECLIGIAAVYGDQGDWQRAARLFGAAEALLTREGTTIWPSNRPDYERAVARARTGTDEGNFYAAWVEGRGMSLDAALELALEPAETAAA